MKSLKLILVIILILATQPDLSSQGKWEREYRAKINEIPEPAKRFMDAFPEPGRLRWYSEESNDGKTFEAKFIFKGIKHSVEFDSVGNLLDVEMAFDFDLLGQDFRRGFEKNLLERFTGYKVIKAQKHFNGENLNIAGMYDNQAELNVQYEIVIRGYHRKKYKLFEIMAGSDGSILAIEEIILKNTDSLEY